MIVQPPTVPKARILVVEDEPNTLSGLVRLLTLMGYPTDGVGSGAEALQQLAGGSYDLVLLDLRLPDMSGVEVMQQAHAAYPDLMFIILTAYAELDSAIAAVRVGATDYLTKPSSADEIGAAVAQALQRRWERLRQQHYIDVIAAAASALQTSDGKSPPAASSTGVIDSGPLLLDRKQGVVWIKEEDRQVSLSRTQASLLACLMLHPDVTLSCLELARYALGRSVESELEAQHIVRPHLSRLRRKLEPNPDEPCWICTRRKEGYVFCSAAAPPKE